MTSVTKTYVKTSDSITEEVTVTRTYTSAAQAISWATRDLKLLDKPAYWSLSTGLELPGYALESVSVEPVDDDKEDE